MNAIVGGYKSYGGIQRADSPISMDAAIAQAAHESLVALYPSQAASFDSLLAEDLRALPNFASVLSHRPDRLYLRIR